jgi:transketolase
VTVLYVTTVRPFDRATLRAHANERVVLIEPYLAGTSAAEVSAALGDVPHRLLSIGVPNVEHRKYGTWREHDAAHGLDAATIRARVGAFLA